MSRRGAKSYHTQGNRDRNEGIIVQALEARGYHVDRVKGKGFPDLVVTKHKGVWFVEVKQLKGTYTPAQMEWRSQWTGPQPICLRTVADAMIFPEVRR